MSGDGKRGGASCVSARAHPRLYNVSKDGAALRISIRRRSGSFVQTQVRHTSINRIVHRHTAFQRLPPVI
jgi:hypothetical protein